ncbi:mediator of RNA polymerase II transcription subunit 12-like protein isoform X1 [Antedon mediterranea]|uniref:mediator of RNA polymerase II transcription subunit 12-like protein isoform X1 n=1 Tax=Antedon mediterranea TaxID=105859 RepID=UPI003AF5CFCB
MIRATWLLKMTHASTQAITDSKVRPKRAQSDPSIEWCQVITRFLKEILSKIADPHQTPSGPNPVSTLQTPTITDSDTAHKMWDYMTTLARYLYEECMLDCHEYLSWLVETVEKVNPKDDNILRLVLPIVMQYVEEFCKGQILSRRLAYFCCRKLATFCSDACNPPQSPTLLSPANRFQANALPPSSLSMIFSEFTNCAQHRPIVLFLSSIVQTVTLQCPSALVWINVGEAKNSNIPGSPLDLLPCAPSSLPLPNPHSLQAQQIRIGLRNSEIQIRSRSRAAEHRWSTDKSQESTAGFTINRVLNTLEILDRHYFDRCDSNNSLDSLYHKIFSTNQSKDGSDVIINDNPVVQLLCEWAVCPQRTGEHRALIVAELLEKRQIELENGKSVSDTDIIDEKTSMSSMGMMGNGTPAYQHILFQFLDTQAPVLIPGNEDSKKSFANLVLLFSELITYDIFSHDKYMCRLIARGDLSTSSLPINMMEIKTEDEEKHQSVNRQEKMVKIKEEVEDDDYEDYGDGSARKQSTSFQDVFQEMIYSNKLKTEPDTSEEINHQPMSAHLPRHLQYATHFPIPQAEMALHDSNQRMVLLYGFGKGRDDARKQIKRIQKELMRIVMNKKESDKLDSKAKKMKYESIYVPLSLFTKFSQLSYFDQHMLTQTCVLAMTEQLANVNQGIGSTLPSIEHISFIFDLMESALNIHGLLEFAIQLLNEVSSLEGDHPWTAVIGGSGKYSIDLCFCITAVLRRYHSSLLALEDQIINVFDVLYGVIRQGTNISECSSAERCILAYLYDLYTSCTHIKVRFSDVFSSMNSKIKQTLCGSLTPSQANQHLDEGYLAELLDDPRKKRPFSRVDLGDLNEHRFSFVCNVLLAICRSQDSDRLNDVSILSAELTANCNSLCAEWLGALKALCCSSNHSCGFNELLCHGEVDVDDISIHDSIAVFMAILIARNCFKLEDVIMHLALTSLIAATPSGGGVQEAEAGARLMCHLLLRLFTTLPNPIHYSETTSSRNRFVIRSSSDRHLLAAAHSRMSVEPLVAVLKAILILSDAGIGTSTFNTQSDEFADDLVYGNIHKEFAPRKPANTLDTAGLSDFAKITLKAICSQDWVQEIFLKNPDGLWSKEVMLDPIIDPSQRQHLLQLVCYPNGVPDLPESDFDDEDDQKLAITRILRNLDQWTLRVSLLDIQLMLKQCPSGDLNNLLDSIAKATIEVFQPQNDEPHRGCYTRRGFQKRRPPPLLEVAGNQSTWLVAPLISKLSSQVQGCVLKAAGNALECVGQTWSKSSKDKHAKSQMSLLSHQPLLSLVLTCLKGQDDQRESLLTSLQTQLTQFFQSPKDDRWEDPKSRRLMHEALQLRLSLVGSMFDTIIRSNQWMTEFALLLLQLITTGTVDLQSNNKLFTIVLDMLSVLINSTLTSDVTASPGAGEENRRQHLTLIKKLRRELGDKNSEGIEKVRQLLPVPKKSIEVITCEPTGCLMDTRGNKITGFEINKKQGLQVSTKQKVNPWDMLEANKNPAPLSWTWFGAVRLERKPLKYMEQYRLNLYHNHDHTKSDAYYLQPPELPADEEPPPAPAQEVEKPIPETEVTQRETKTSTDSNKKKRQTTKRKKMTPNTHNRDFPVNQHMPYQERPAFMPSSYFTQQNPSFFPQQQPLPPGPGRVDRTGGIGQANSKAALNNMLRNRQSNNQSSQQVQMQLYQRRRQQQHMQVRHQLQQHTIQSRNPDAMFPYKTQDANMHHVNHTQPMNNYNYNNQMMQPHQQMGDSSQTNFTPSYGMSGQTGMMQTMRSQPQQQAAYMNPQRTMQQSNRMQDHMHRSAMHQGMGGMQQQATQGVRQNPNYMAMQPDRQRQLLHQQQQQQKMQALRQGNIAQPTDQQTAALVRQLQIRMPRGMGQQQPGHPYTYQ